MLSQFTIPGKPIFYYLILDIKDAAKNIVSANGHLSDTMSWAKALVRETKHESVYLLQSPKLEPCDHFKVRVNHRYSWPEKMLLYISIELLHSQVGR